jgi:hypothetical protein
MLTATVIGFVAPGLAGLVAGLIAGSVAFAGVIFLSPDRSMLLAVRQ